MSVDPQPAHDDSRIVAACGLQLSAADFAIDAHDFSNFNNTPAAAPAQFGTASGCDAHVWVLRQREREREPAGVV
jgi:hypothetical protein